MRIQGKATVNRSDPLLEEFPGANLIVRVAIEKTWINCPRYIPTYTKIASSKYIPRTDGSAPIAIGALPSVLGIYFEEAIFV